MCALSALGVVVFFFAVVVVVVETHVDAVRRTFSEPGNKRPFEPKWLFA